MVTDLLDLARAGDGEAFRELLEPYQRELEVHCYRMLGSLTDAEDVMQEALLAAWQGLGGFEGRSSIRTWLYQIATTRCLNARRSARRHQPAASPTGARPPRPTRLGEVTWLEPYPDALLDGLPSADPGPEARYEAREAISLAFITAVQRLPPRQRAALILRDVLGFPASEAARILAVTDESLTGALKRARASLRDEMPARGRARQTARPNAISPNGSPGDDLGAPRLTYSACLARAHLIWPVLVSDGGAGGTRERRRERRVFWRPPVAPGERRRRARRRRSPYEPRLTGRNWKVTWRLHEPDRASRQS